MIKQPPLAKGLPIVGSIVGLARDATEFFFSEYRRLGPIYRVRVLGNEFKVLAGPELCRLMITQPDTLSNWEVFEPIMQDFGGRQNLVMLEGEAHARMRRLFAEHFSRATVDQNVSALVTMTQQALLAHSQGKAIPVVYFMQRLIGTELGLLANDCSPDDYFEDIMVYWHAMIEILMFSKKPRKLLEQPAHLRARRRVEEFAARVVERRRAIAPEQRDPNNFIDNMLAAQEEDPDFLSDREILFNALFPYFAGIDTAANISAFLLYELLRHPTLLEQCRQEIDQAFANGIPTPAALRNMKVLHLAILETLRLYPIAAILRRTAAKDFEFAGYTVKRGEPLMVSTTAAQHDPRYFPHPQEFDIERFMPPRNEHKVQGVYAPFGAGTHTCLGSPLAEAQITLTLATLLHSIDFSLENPNYKLKIGYAPGITPKGLAIKVNHWRVQPVTP